jgi:enterochelin esterase family protein
MIPERDLSMSSANLFLMVALTSAAVEQQSDRPAPSAVRGSQYPRLHSDGTVTFRVTAPSAKHVQVAPRGTGNGLGDKPLDLTRDERGAWTVRTTVRPGFHYYQLVVDGFACNDPASRTYFGWGQESSGLEVPDPALDFYSFREVPHGQVRVCTYFARATATPRQAYVYTPPGYDEQPARRYPVLYLQHGAGESERGWTEQGKANLILDNLIAANKAVPMLVVMENGYADPAGQTANPADRSQSEGFSNLVVKDLIPFIDGSFRTLADREHRAIAGLSMGGGQAMRTGLGHLDLFAWVGTFSGALRDFHIESSYGGVFRDAAAANRQLRLLWIGCGTEDRLIQSAREIHQLLTQQQVQHVWYEIPGAHEWQVWRKHLDDFAPRLFRQAEAAAR